MRIRDGSRELSTYSNRLRCTFYSICKKGSLAFVNRNEDFVNRDEDIGQPCGTIIRAKGTIRMSHCFGGGDMKDATSNTVNKLHGNASYYFDDMTGAIIDTVGGSKRRLPTWMWSKDTPKNGTSGNLDEICPAAGKLTEIQDVVSNIGSVSREFDALVPEKTKDSEHKEMFLEYDSRKNTRKSKRGGFNETTSSFGRNKRKLKEEVIGCEQSLSRQHLKFKRAKSNCVKDLSQGVTEVEVELTVEDLISIAEECVSADKEIQHVTRKSGSTSESLGSSVPPPILNEGKLDYAIRACPLFSKCTRTSTSHLSKPEQKQKGESATFSCNINTQAGDAAQDMLELFLGPLLKKAPPKKPDPQKTEVLISAFESDKQVRSFEDVEKQAPLMKKKSSLKDKVAMLF